MMARDFLAFLGLVFLTILILVAIGLIVYLFDTFEIIDVSNGVFAWLKSVGNLLRSETPPVESDDLVEKLNPTGTPALPTSITNAPALSPSPSQINPLEPAVYRALVAERLKNFVSALESWRNLNNELVKDRRLANDPAWLDKMRISLEVVVITGNALEEVGPPPDDYTAIDSWFNSIPAEADGLKQSYLGALTNGDEELFLIAGDHFVRIKEALRMAVQEMIAQGWQIE